MMLSRIRLLAIIAPRALSVIAMVLAAFAASISAYGEDTIKIAYTDPMSGPFAQVGQRHRMQLQYILEDLNAKGGALGRKFELIVFDNKMQPSGELIALKSIADQNIPFIVQIDDRI